MRRFLRKTALLSLPLILLLVLVNYFGDAASIFDPEYERAMASIILNGENVTNIDNYNERVFQRELISSFDSKKEVVVFGSSRTMLINSYHFPDAVLFNNSVSGAALQDVIALFQMYALKNNVPDTIVLSVDPWLFNDNNGQSRWDAISNYYENYSSDEAISLQSLRLSDYGQLLSLSYFQASLATLSRRMTGGADPVATQRANNPTNTKLTDGSMVYNVAYRTASQAEVDAKIRGYLVGEIFNLENYDEISVRFWNEFEGFVLDLLERNVEVEFFLCPYPPLVYRELQENYPQVVRAETLVDSFASANNITVYGSYNPYDLGFDETFFYDGMHCNEKGVNALLSLGR